MTTAASKTKQLEKLIQEQLQGLQEFGKLVKLGATNLTDEQVEEEGKLFRGNKIRADKIAKLFEELNSPAAYQDSSF